MLAYITHPDCLLHNMGDFHPEQPARLTAIEETLITTGLMDKLQYYQAPLVTREQLTLAHDEDYVETIFSLSPKSGYKMLDPDTLMNPYTLNAALYAAGAGVYAVELIMQDKVQRAFCNVRPPGHHAEKNKAMGFCFFNNIVIAALYAIKNYDLKRVAIIDFDVHHGNGTEDIVKEDERILYCSSFQSPFYPFSGVNTQNTHIINTPLQAGTSGKEFREKVAQQWFQKIISFQPEFIFFSAGFDAYQHDTMANLFFTEEDYFWITDQIAEMTEKTSQGRIVSMLEGGYHLTGLGQSVVAHISALL